MAKLNGFSMRHEDVDTTQREGGGALPDGFYRFEIDEAADKDHFDGRKGYKIDVVLEVIEPAEFKGRKMFLDFGVVDPTNEEFEGWAREGLGRLLKAIDFEGQFDDPDQLVGQSGIAKYGLDRKRSDKQNKRFGKVWGYVYPEDERDWLDKNELGASERQEEWFPGKQTPAGGDRDRGSRGGRDDRSRDRDRGGREERGSRDDRGGSRDRDDRGSRGGRDERDSDRGRDRDRDDSRGRGRDDNRDERGNEDDGIPFNEDRGSDRDDGRPQRGGGSNPWNRGGKR